MFWKFLSIVYGSHQDEYVDVIFGWFKEAMKNCIDCFPSAIYYYYNYYDYLMR